MPADRPEQPDAQRLPDGPDAPRAPSPPDPVTAAPAEEGVDLARAMFSAASTGRRRPTTRAPARARDPRREADDRDPQPVSAAVEQMLTERGWQTAAAVAGAVARWSEIAGVDVAAHVTPLRFADGVLFVEADSTAWATQLRYLAPTIVRRLNEELGDGTVQRVDVRGPAQVSWRRGGYRVPGRGPFDTYG